MIYRTLKELYNPTFDGVQYSGLYTAILNRYVYTPSYSQEIIATLLDGYLYDAHGDSVLRRKYAIDLQAAYNAMYHTLATHESDIQRYINLTAKDFGRVMVTESTQTEYGEAVIRKAYAQDRTQHSLGAVHVEVTNAERHNVTTDYTSPYDINNYAERAKSDQTTDEFKDETDTNAHTNTDTRDARTDTDTHTAHTDREQKSTILSMSAKDYYELEKMLIADNAYDEINKVILSAVCLSVY